MNDNNRQEFHTKPDWCNFDVTSINRMTAHSKWEAYENIDDAVAVKDSTNIMTLNGDYQFKLFNCPDYVDDFYSSSYSGEFSNITIPSNWELQGFSKPVYTNFIYPWDYNSDENCNILAKEGMMKVPNPPYLPNHNETGCYKKSFILPQNFSNRIYISDLMV